VPWTGVSDGDRDLARTLPIWISYYLQPGYDFADEFDFGLDLVLDGIQQRLDGNE